MYEIYFSNYGTGSLFERHDEKYILKKFRKKLLKNNSEPDKYLKRGITLPVERNTVDVFQYAWQNGTLNLITPLSFDLTEASMVKKKAFISAGLLNTLGAVATDKGYKFDLLIARPQHKDLFYAFEDAVAILKKSNAPKSLIFEEHLDEYTDKTIAALIEHRP